MENHPNDKIMLERTRNVYDFEWICCINGILDSVGLQIFLELIQSATQKLLKWVFQENCHLCILKNGMVGFTFPWKQYLLFNVNLNFETYHFVFISYLSY